MSQDHNFIELAKAQLAGRTLYCAGLDIHPFGTADGASVEGLMRNYKTNMLHYAFEHGGEINKNETYEMYLELISIIDPDIQNKLKLAGLLAAIQDYTCRIINCVIESRVYVFKPQLGTYIQLGVYGMVMLKKLRQHIAKIERERKQRIIVILDCKPGDIFSTQQGYIVGFMGDLRSFWGLHYTPFDFDAINPTPYMGRDVFVLEDKKGNVLPGLDWMRKGKCMFSVNFTSNPSAGDYQRQEVRDFQGRNKSMDRLKKLRIKPTIQMLNAADMHFLSQKHGLEKDGLSQFGLVVGATQQCNGSIRRVFPGYTGLNPAFGAQSEGRPPLEPFEKVVLELISEGSSASKYAGQGGIFSSSRGTMFPYNKKYGGTGVISDLGKCLIASIARHRALEEEMYNLPYVIDAGIPNPFKITA